MVYLNLYHFLDKFSAKGDNLHEMLKPISGEKNKKIQNIKSEICTQHAKL